MLKEAFKSVLHKSTALLGQNLSWQIFRQKMQNLVIFFKSF